MQITGRRKKIAFFLILGICLVAAAVALTGSWIILNWRERVLLFFGLVFFIAIITGLILNTSFLVREIRLQRTSRQLHQRRNARTEDARSRRSASTWKPCSGATWTKRSGSNSTS